MKLNKILFGLFFIFLLSFASVSATVEDDFNRSDSGTLGVATNGNTWTEISQGQWSSLYADKLLMNQSSSGSTAKSSLVFDTADPTRIDFLYTGNQDYTGQVQQAYIGESDSSADWAIQLSMGQSDDSLQYYGSGAWTDTGYNFVQHTEVLISLRNIDYTADTFDIYVDDVLQHTGATFRNNKGIDLTVFAVNTLGDFYIDCITTAGSSCGYDPITHHIDGIYLSPNGSSVYTDESDLRGYVTVNSTTDIYVNYTYYVDGVATTTGQYTGSPSGNVYTLPVFSSSNFVQTDGVTVSAIAVNQSTGSATSTTNTSASVSIANRLPSATISWSSTNPLNNTNFSGIITPADSDADNLNISYEVFKNGVIYTSGTSLNNADPYGAITLFTIDEATTDINDSFTFNASVDDGFDIYASAASAAAVVMATSNFTIFVNDQWSANSLENISVLIYDELATTLAGSDLSLTLTTDGTESITNDKYLNDGEILVKRVHAFASSTYSLYDFIGETYDVIVQGQNIGAEFFVTYNEQNVSAYNSEDITPDGYSGTIFEDSYFLDLNQSYVVNNSFISPLVSNETANIIVLGDDYFSRTYADWPLNTTLHAELYQSVINFTAYEFMTGDLVTGATFTVSGQSGEQLNLSAGSFTVDVSSSYFDISQNFNVSALDVKTVNVTGLYDAVLNITAAHIVGNSTINEFDGWVYNDDTGYNVSFSTTGGYAQVGLLQGYTYQVYVDSEDYAFAVENVTVSASLQEERLYLYKFNSLRIQFYDELTGSAMSQLVTLYTIGQSSSYTNSTTNGSLYLAVLDPESYELRYSSDNYTSRSYYLTLSNNSFQDISLYLLPMSADDIELVTLTVYDQEVQPVESAVVKLLKYNNNSGNYELIASDRTDFTGLSTFQVETGFDDFYYWIIEYEGEVKFISSASRIKTTSLSQQISIGSTAGEDLILLTEFGGELVYDSSNQRFRFLYVQANGETNKVCLRTERVTDFQKTEVDSSCSTSNSAELLNTISPVNGSTYVASAYYYIDGYPVQIAQESKEFSDRPDFGLAGVFVQLLLTLVVLVITLVNREWELLSVMTPLTIVAGRIIGLHQLSYSASIGLFVVGGIIAYIIQRKR